MKQIINSNEIQRAIARGLDYLCQCATTGKWHGFPTLAGESQTWVTGFILAHISSLVTKKEERDVRQRAEAFLLSVRKSAGGWSYGEGVPADADSTAWCINALSKSRRLTPSIKKQAERFIMSHRTGDGFSTYRLASGIGKFIRAKSDDSIAGWTSAHSDVTAAVLLAGMPTKESKDFKQIVADLVGKQSGAGFFDAYWWRGPLYTTTLILRALSKQGFQLPKVKATLILRALQREQLRGGGFSLGSSTEPDPFTTALGLECFSHLTYLGGCDERRRVGSALLECQQANGGWNGDYVMRIPSPSTVDPKLVGEWSRQGGGGNCYILDKGGLFATALSCYTLDCWRRAESHKGRGKVVTLRPSSAPERIMPDDVQEVQVTPS